MDPIGTTYVGIYPTTLASEKNGPKADSLNRPAKNTNVSSGAAQPTGTSQADYVQLGIKSSSSKQEDFSTYNSTGQVEGGSQKSVATINTDQSRTALPEQKQKEDPQVQQTIARLKATEEKVKAHEAAHKSAGGAATGPISYTYTRGPDGRNYITGGEVPITISSGSTPQETISRMQQVIQAALAPADPSPQDRAVAAQAANIKQQAQQEKTQSSNSQSAAGSEASANISATQTNRTVGSDKPQGIEKANQTAQAPVLQGSPAAIAAENNPAKAISVYA